MQANLKKNNSSVGGLNTDELLLSKVTDPKYKNYIQRIDKVSKDAKKEEDKESSTLAKS
jgi:hypothetical protein